MECIYNTALNDISGGKFYDIADFGGWNIVPVASAAGLILDLKPYLDEDADFKAGAGVCYDQNLTADGKIYSVREQIEAVGFWYNEALFKQAGAKVPAEWNTWADFEEAVQMLVAGGITPFGLNAGWPTNILTAGRFQADAATRAFYAKGADVMSFDDPAFREVMTFMQENLAPVNVWLEEHIWRHGRMYAPGELMERAFEEPFDPKYYTDYWERKMTDIYGL